MEVFSSVLIDTFGCTCHHGNQRDVSHYHGNIEKFSQGAVSRRKHSHHPARSHTDKSDTEGYYGNLLPSNNGYHGNYKDDDTDVSDLGSCHANQGSSYDIKHYDGKQIEKRRSRDRLHSNGHGNGDSREVDDDISRVLVSRWSGQNDLSGCHSDVDRERVLDRGGEGDRGSGQDSPGYGRDPDTQDCPGYGRALLGNPAQREGSDCNSRGQDSHSVMSNFYRTDSIVKEKDHDHKKTRTAEEVTDSEHGLQAESDPQEGSEWGGTPPSTQGSLTDSPEHGTPSQGGDRTAGRDLTPEGDTGSGPEGTKDGTWFILECKKCSPKYSSFL